MHNLSFRIWDQLLSLRREERTDILKRNLEDDDAGGIRAYLVLGIVEHDARLGEIGRIAGQGNVIERTYLLGEKILQQLFIAQRVVGIV